MLNIAVDGTASSGKGAVCARLAKKLGIIHFETGAIYRAIGLFVINEKLDPNNEQQVVANINRIDIKLKHNNGEQITILNNVDVTSQLHTSQVSDICSITSAYPKVREMVLDIQRKCAETYDLIMEGRDITSHVLPNAEFRFYIDANIDVRANRRYQEFLKRGENISLQEVKNDLLERDRRDMKRELSPLILTEGTIYLDNSEMTIEEEVEFMYKIVKGEIK